MNDPVEQGFFTEENSAEVVVSRNARCADPRLKEVMAVLIRHLHAAIKEIEPTQEEWFAAIRFLTETGHKSDDWRQEFILLSDTMGVSMLVDAINNRKPTGATESTVLGPFHVGGAPELPNGADICLDQRGDPMVVRGRVTRLGRPTDRRREARRLAGQRRGLLRRAAEGRAARLQPPRRVPRRRGRNLLVPRGEAEILPHPQRRPGGPTPATGLAGTPTARRISTTSSRPPGTSHSPPTSSFRMIPTSTATRYSA